MNRKQTVGAVFSRPLMMAAAAAACLGGCARHESKTPTAADEPPSVTQFSQTPTDDECRQFAEAFEKAAKSADGAAMSRLIDWDALLERATTGINAGADFNTNFLRGVKERAARSKGLAAEVVNQEQRGGSYRFLHSHTVGEEKRAVFRLILPEKGVNYHDVALVRRSDGQVRATDIYTFLIGETYSQTLRHAYLPAAAEASKSVLARLTQTENDLVKNLDKLGEMATLILTHRWQEAIDAYRRLPISLQQDKAVLVWRALAASNVNEKALDEAIEAFSSLYPGDTCPDLLTLGHYFDQKQYIKFRAAVDRLDRAVGGDPYLNVARATSYLQEKRYKEAREHAVAAAKAEPDLLSAYWTQVAIALGQKDFDEVSRLLTVLEGQLHVQVPDVTTLPEYSEYVKSPQYKKWMARKR